MISMNFLTEWPDLRENMSKFHPLHTEPRSATKEKTTRPQLQQNYSLASLWYPEVSWHPGLGIRPRSATLCTKHSSPWTSQHSHRAILFSSASRERHSVPRVTRSSQPRVLRGPGRVISGSNKTSWENSAGTLFWDPRSELDQKPGRYRKQPLRLD